MDYTHFKTLLCHLSKNERENQIMEIAEKLKLSNYIHINLYIQESEMSFYAKISRAETKAILL